MTKPKNMRSLDTLADNIHKLERGNIFDIGDLLIEARAQCEYGHWGEWLSNEFDWSPDTAARYMKVAEMSGRFRTVRNLKLAANTLYALADECRDDDDDCEDDNLPVIIQELAKHATKKRLTHKEAERVIKVGIGRRRHGDHPDATLFKLAELDDYSDESWPPQAVAELLKREPETDENADLIVNDIEQKYLDESKAKSDAEWAALFDNLERDKAKDDEANQEAESILDGAPPILPPPITPPEPQKLESYTPWAGAAQFDVAVRRLLELRTKPVARFVGVFSPDELHEVSDFLVAVAVAEQADKAKPTVPPAAPEPSGAALEWKTTPSHLVEGHRMHEAHTELFLFRIVPADTGNGVCYSVQAMPLGKDYVERKVIGRATALETAKEIARQHANKAKAQTAEATA
jgi:hypothetical protein